MMSLKLLLFIGAFLSLQQLALSDPIPTSQPSPEEEGCKNSSSVLKAGFRSCLEEYVLPDNETRQMYGDIRCPMCAHVCNQSQFILDCAYNVLEATVPCNKNVRDMSTGFLRGIFQSTVEFFCEGGGDRLTTIDDDDNMLCIARKEGKCGVDIIHENIDPENRNKVEDSSSSSSEEVNEQTACRRLTNAMYCASRKAESCNEETSNLLNSYADHLRKSPQCSKFYNEN